MIKLPFIVEPKQDVAKVGHKGIGIVEIPRYYALQDDEMSFIADNETSLEKLAIDTARAIREKTPVTETDPASPESQEKDENPIIATANAFLGSDYEFFVDNVDELLEFSKKKKRISRKKDVVLVTAIIKYRLVSDWTIENTTDVSLLPPGMFKAILEFARDEESGIEEEIPPVAENIEKAA
jgi:hypothetical protein